ncbi:MAG: fructose-6-phosphate aldolase [Candidatus Micrarchaeota archaeon]
MKFFLDSASLEEVKKANEIGLLDGVTTNPSLIAKAGGDYKTRVREICEVCKGPVSAEVLATDFSGMMQEARAWSELAKNVVVKIPITLDGLKAIKALKAEGIKTNATLCFSENQALLVAKAGAYFVSPFVGRLDDAGKDGMALIGNIRKIYDNYGFETQILVASVRNPEHVTRSALYGADCITMPLKVMEELSKHPLTDAGIKKFLDDYNAALKK